MDRELIRLRAELAAMNDQACRNGEWAGKLFTRCDALGAELAAVREALVAANDSVKEWERIAEKQLVELIIVRETIKSCLSLNEYPERWEYLVRPMLEAALGKMEK